MVVEQIPLSLKALSHYSAEYFVPHSGVAESLLLLEESLEQVANDDAFFQPIYLSGVAGVGKSHLLAVVLEKARAMGIRPEKIFLREEVAEGPRDEAGVGEIVSAYETKKTQGGLFILSSRVSPHLFSNNPHLTSRVLSSVILELKPPSIEELRPTLVSLLERRNLRLSDRAIEYILRRVPTNPLSLWGILARIDDRALREGRAVSLNFIREILGEI